MLLLSTKQLAAVSVVSRSSIQRILKHHMFHPYKIKLLQKLNGDDFESDRLTNNPNFFFNICFSDKCSFFLNGTVNRHYSLIQLTLTYIIENDKHYLSENGPEIYRETVSGRSSRDNVVCPRQSDGKKRPNGHGIAGTSLAVKRAPRVKETTVKKTKTTMLASATTMKRAVGPWVSRVRSKLHENPIVVCSLEILVQARQRWIKAEPAKGLENYYNGKRRIGRVVAAVIRGDAICTCCCQHSLCIKLY
ncbi:hypothetical protein ALC56_03635 [Trachymyrmex septentrionalis]|uniref:Uncharacterized protein n=1 Tax=Trachymyrmex septentrionalis TaxID=34720 RepID=A0A151JZA8_9HYME|nr:hypothetical protein ALC56_03635 [Trachymyrmex septentrionalis]